MSAVTHRILLDGRDVRYTVRQTARARRAGLRVIDNQLEVVLPLRAGAGRAGEIINRHKHWVLRQLRRMELRRAAHTPGTYLLRGKEIPMDLLPGEWLDRWLADEAEKDIRARLAARCAEMGVSYDRLTFRDQRTVWGSCSKRRRSLSFNVRLVMAPPEVLDYIVVHELAHLTESNHGPRFWRIVAAHCPGHAEHRAWLRTNGWRLRRPGLSGPSGSLN